MVHLDFRAAFLGHGLVGALRLAMFARGCDDVGDSDECSGLMLNWTKSTSFEEDGDGSSLFFWGRERVARCDMVL